MTHIAIQEKKDGKVVDWMEQVTDQQYRRWWGPDHRLIAVGRRVEDNQKGLAKISGQP